MNSDDARLYAANRLTVTRQLHYSQREPAKSLDLGLGLNGIPVATAELKNRLTGQAAVHARHQYMTDRDPRDKIFRFKQRALVHFAVDPDEVSMTTRLDGKRTRFLPFNRGDDHGAGNPPNPRGYRTSYLWERGLATRFVAGHPGPLHPAGSRREADRREESPHRDDDLPPL